MSHIDWKSTAKTGVLMLREMEEPAGADITLVLDGTSDHVVGEAPDTNFELAVRAVGSVADYVLRAGRGVSLVCHERMRRHVRLTPDGGGRRVLLETLAETRPDATAPLAQVLRRLLTDRLSPLRAQTLTVVGLTMDPEMARALISLREDGVRLSFLYVPGTTFATASAGGPLLPFLPPRERGSVAPGGAARDNAAPGGAAPRAGDPPHARVPELAVETRALLLSLSSAGVRCLTLGHGDDLTGVLSAWHGGRPTRAASGW